MKNKELSLWYEETETNIVIWEGVLAVRVAPSLIYLVKPINRYRKRDQLEIRTIHSRKPITSEDYWTCAEVTCMLAGKFIYYHAPSPEMFRTFFPRAIRELNRRKVLRKLDGSSMIDFLKVRLNPDPFWDASDRQILQRMLDWMSVVGKLNPKAVVFNFDDHMI